MSRSVRCLWPLVPSLALVLGLASACVAPQPVAMGPPNPIPPPRPEVIPKPPVSEQALTWQPGHWDWDGTGFVWREGAWVPLAGHGTEWMPGFWSQQPNGAWVWVAPHWM